MTSRLITSYRAFIGMAEHSGSSWPSLAIAASVPGAHRGIEPLALVEQDGCFGCHAILRNGW
jgi:hypothetical protein